MPPLDQAVFIHRKKRVGGEVFVAMNTISDFVYLFFSSLFM